MAKYSEPEIHMHEFTGVDKVKFLLNRYIEDYKKTKKNVLVYFDPDIDGLISGVLVCKFLARLGITFDWYINSNRAHGFFIPRGKISNTNIINVDSAVQREKIQWLLEEGCNIISLDHHINEKYLIEEYNEKTDKYGVVVDNHYVTEPETGTYLSGAGVVFETFICIDKDFNTRENRSLVGLTLLSDVCPIENDNAHGYLYELFNHPYRGYIKYLIDGVLPKRDYTFGVPRLDRNFVDYSFSPALNACFRFNKQDLCVNFSLGLASVDITCKDTQRDLVNELIELAQVRHFSNVSFIRIDVRKIPKNEESLAYKYKDILSNFIGLVANKYLNSGRSAIAFLITEEGTVGRGSFRGYCTGLDYLKELTKDHLIDGAGHESAFGILKIKPTKKNCEDINKRCKAVDDTLDRNKEDNIISISNMSSFLNGRAYKIAERNQFCLDQNRTYVRYKGSNIVENKKHDRFIQYYLDGVEVKCFDSSMSIEKDLVQPILDRGKLVFYLKKAEEGL